MSALGRKIGVVGFLLSVGVACTQLFGEQRQNTLAPGNGTPFGASAPLQPGALPGAAAAGGICSPGETRCDGALLQACSDDLSGWVTTKRCAAAALCQASPGACLDATCSEDEMTCAGAVLQKCNADRTGWEVFDTCLSPAHCKAELRQCMAEPCNPGDRRCDRSELDQSPGLEVCQDDRLDWRRLDACVTRELCDQTLTLGGPQGGLVLGSDGQLLPQAPRPLDQVLLCNLPACNVGDVRCDGTRLQYCSEGRTGWIQAEECGSEALCAASATNVSTSGTPTCFPPACAAGQHLCTEAGVLQVCAEDRTGFRDLETCIGAPFCNAVLADQGEAGCRDAPCEPGEMLCNGPQIQVCRDDRTGFDNVGEPCETAALCNPTGGNASGGDATEPLNAVCDAPACRRGATSADEFRCEGAALQRCNESLTGFDTVQTCVTAALCDASQRQNGCRPPVCRPGQNDCSGGFLRVCNDDQTGFVNIENCGSQGQCDANAGQCADPCEPGATRCNQNNGDLERCTDPLLGWQPIADCQLGLCNLAAGRCDICRGGEFSCADGQLRQCAADGSRFERQGIGNECSSPQPPGQGPGIRACQGNNLTYIQCPEGCTGGRCHECTGTEEQCVGNTQHRFCNNGFFGPASNCADANRCNGTETCQGNRCVAGQQLVCGDEGNPCTNNFCEPANGCVARPTANSVTCNPPAGTILSCNNGNAQVTACGQLGCGQGRTVCNNCNANRCQGNTFTACNGGLFGNPQNCPDDPGNNPCIAPLCTQNGCTTQQVGGACTSGGRAGQCQQGQCRVCTPNQGLGCFNNQNQVCNAAGTGVNTQSCPDDNNPCTTPSCTGQGCGFTNRNGQPCTLNGQSGTCNGATCQVQICTPLQQTCAGNNRRVCAADGASFTTNAPCPAPTDLCFNGQCVECRGTAADCGAGQTCNVFNRCITPAICTPGAFTACAADGNSFTRCNATGTTTNERVNCPAGQACVAASQRCVNAVIGTIPLPGDAPGQ